MSTEHPPATDRVTLRREVSRGDHDPATIRAILAAGLVAHVGVAGPDGPIVLPMAYGITDDTVYLHGATGNAILRAAQDREVCVTVTLLDEIIIGRSPFHNSMNYRSVVVRGQGRLVTDESEQVDALRRVADHVVESWDHGREPTPAEVRRTQVIAVGLTEASAKVRDGGPADEPDDVAGPHWGGHVPITSRFEAPIPSADLATGRPPPPTVAALSGQASAGQA